MIDSLAAIVVALPAVRAQLSAWHRHDERGEGVISAAIAVLIVAFLGALMWAGFKQLWTTTKDKTDQQITQIGN